MKAMRAARGVSALLAAAGIGLATAHLALADEPLPDPNVPNYWDSGENAEGTGPAPLPTYQNPYWKDGENAGGTGDAPQPDDPNYWDTGENAGAF